MGGVGAISDASVCMHLCEKVILKPVKDSVFMLEKILFLVRKRRIVLNLCPVFLKTVI